VNNRPQTVLPVTRRDFLRSAGGFGFLAFSGFAPSFLARAAETSTPKAEKDRAILVILQLAGGNDGLNTVIPYANDAYYNLRPNLAIRGGFHPLDDQVALHPACDPLRRLHDAGRLAIVQNVGYPNPNRSHFRSTEIWETAGDGASTPHTGWLGRYFDNACEGCPERNDPSGVHLGDSMPQAFLSDEPRSIFGLRPRGGVGFRGQEEAESAYEALLGVDHGDGAGHYLRHAMMDTLVTERRVRRTINRYRAEADYPGSKLGQGLKRIAALIHGGMETRVYFVSQGGYDTHANQTNRHGNLLGDMARSLAAFQKDLASHGTEDQVLTMTFSEFGRRPGENGGGGTDHGTAAPLFVMGGAVEGGVHGEPPDLAVGPNQDLAYATDFRSVYSTLLSRWFDTDPASVLGESFPDLGFLRA